MLKDPKQQRVKVNLAEALVAVDPNGSAILRAMLPQSDVPTQYEAIWALRGDKTPENRAAIVPYLKSSDPMLQSAALNAIGRMAPWQDAVLDEVERLCSAKDERVRAAAIRAAVTTVDPDRLRRIVERAENDHAKGVVSVVVYAKRRLGMPTTQPVSGPRRMEPEKVTSHIGRGAGQKWSRAN
jgi:HEAT repeat protein